MNKIIKAPLSGIISGYPLKNRERNDKWREKKESGRKKRKKKEERIEEEERGEKKRKREREKRERKVMIVPKVLLQLTSLYTASSVR